MNLRASVSFVLPALLLLLGGCVIIPSSGGTGGGGTGGSFFASSSASSGGSAGGDIGVGGGGGGVGGGGGGGGVPSCVTDADGVKDLLACDALNTQKTGDICGPMMNLAPLANGTCKQGFAIFQGGAFDVLHSCLQNIEGDAVNACDDAQVTSCVNEMYKAACPSEQSAATCDAIATKLCINGEVFDTQGCLLDTNPLNDIAFQQLANCITNSPEADCNKAYKSCFDQLLTF